MSAKEKIQKYIARTGISYSDSSPYGMLTGESLELVKLAHESPMNAIILAFEYGRAKGERHARNQKKKEKRTA